MKVSGVIAFTLASAANAQAPGAPVAAGTTSAPAAGAPNFGGFSFSLTGQKPETQACLYTCLTPMVTEATTCSGGRPAAAAPGTLRRRQAPAAGASPAADTSLNSLFNNIGSSLGQAAKAASQAASQIAAQGQKARECFCQANTKLKASIDTCVPKNCPTNTEAPVTLAVILNASCNGVKGFTTLAAPTRPAGAAQPAAAPRAGSKSGA